MPCAPERSVWVRDLFSKAGMTWLGSLALDAEGEKTLARHLRQLSQVEAEFQLLDDELAQHAYENPQIKLLMSLPGVDYAVAESMLAVLGDPTRFEDADRAAAYFGLVPSTRQSGSHCYHGRITKQGSSHGRWMLIQAAQHVAAHPGDRRSTAFTNPKGCPPCATCRPARKPCSIDTA